jgi:hypothetical protein
MRMTVGNTEAAIAFLQSWEPDGPWLLTAIEPDSGKIQTRPFSDANSAQRWIERYQGKRNIYFSPNRVRPGLTRKAKKTDITHLLTLHTDRDPPKDPKTDLAVEQAAILDRLKGHNRRPTAIIFSGGGYQGFWRLAQPAPVNDNIAALEAYNRGLEQSLGGDHCHNIDRIMRLPGTLNIPDAKKRAAGRVETLAELVYFDLDRVYQLSDFTPADEPVRPEPQPQPDDLERILDSLPKQIIDRLKATAPDRSQALFKVIAALVRHCLSDETIERIIRAFPSGIGSKYIGRSDLGIEIARIRSKTAPEPPGDPALAAAKKAIEQAHPDPDQVIDILVDLVKPGSFNPAEIDLLVHWAHLKLNGAASKTAIKQTLREKLAQLRSGTDRERFTIEDNCLVYWKTTDGGNVPVKLANFAAWIVEDQIYDDGAVEFRRYVLEGKLANGTPLPACTVPIKEFVSPLWVDKYWGAKPIVHTGGGTSMLSEAIKTISGRVRERRIYGHTGWRRIDDQWLYLHAGGAIGADGPVAEVSVELPGDLAGYHLPVAQDLQKAVRASLQLLKLNAPLTAAVYRAPLIAFCPVDFGLFSVGSTGTLKSALQGTAMAHWGPCWHGKHFPANWSGTVNSLEKKGVRDQGRAVCRR